MVAAAYRPAHSQTPKPKPMTWGVEVVVFHTAKHAAAAAQQLATVEKACPSKRPPLPGLPNSIPLVGAHSTGYAVDGRRGYRTVDMVSTLDLGNVLLDITESGDIGPGTATRQEKWRQTVTRLMLTRLDRLLG